MALGVSSRSTFLWMLYYSFGTSVRHVTAFLKAESSGSAFLFLFFRSSRIFDVLCCHMRRQGVIFFNISFWETGQFSAWLHTLFIADADPVQSSSNERTTPAMFYKCRSTVHSAYALWILFIKEEARASQVKKVYIVTRLRS
jgi:hypothetical protein